MALSIGFRILSCLPSCYSSYGALNFYPDGTFTHCSCQPSLDAHLPVLIRAILGVRCPAMLASAAFPSARQPETGVQTPLLRDRPRYPRFPGGRVRDTSCEA